MNRTGRPRVLFFAPILEYPPAGGPQLSVVNAVKVLHEISELHIVTTVPIDRPGAEETARFFRAHSVALVQAPTSRWVSRNKWLARPLRWVRRLLARFYARLDARYVVRYGDTHDISVYWVDRVLEHAFSVFAELRRYRPNARIVADTCSVYSRFVLRELPLVSNPMRRIWIRMRGRKKEREERILTTTADVLTAVSELDAQYFRSISAKPERIRLFSNVIDLKDYANLDSPDEKQVPAVLLLGSFGHPNSPMDRAATWMIDDVMPRVLQQLPQAHLYIVGRNADKTQGYRASKSVTVVGQVPSVLPFLKKASATIVPLRFESGTRFKILESGAARIPCVSTTLGAEGIAITNGEDVLIADTAEEFAAAIVRVLGDPEYARSLGSRLHNLIAERYSLETQKREGQAILKFLGESTVAASAA